MATKMPHINRQEALHTVADHQESKKAEQQAAACKVHAQVQQSHTEAQVQEGIDVEVENHRRGAGPHNEEGGLAHCLQCMIP